MQRNHFVIIFTITLVVALGLIISGYYLFGDKKAEEGGEGDIVSSQSENNISETDSNTKKFTETSLGLSFEYPKDLVASSFGSVYDETGETILVQKTSEANGVQILVSEFDEDITLTKERIKKDLPDLSIVEPKEVIISGVGDGRIRGVRFYSNNSFMGDSVELWFTYEKRLYQVSAPKSGEELFNQVVNSWQLK